MGVYRVRTVSVLVGRCVFAVCAWVWMVASE